MAGREGAAAEVVSFVEGDLRRGMGAEGDGGEAEQGLVVHDDVSLMSVLLASAHALKARAESLPVTVVRTHRTGQGINA